MGKRTWLNTQLATEYLPAIAQLPDTEAGHQQAIDLAATLRQSWIDRNFTKLSQLQPLFDQTRSQIKAKFGIDHFSLKYFGFTTAEYTELNNQKQQQTADRNEAVKQINAPDAIVAKAVALLEDSPHWFDLAAALAVLTGRRSSEILATAQFAKASQWSVLFTGALKRRGERQRLSFEIPTLTTADRVVAALATLRQQLPDVVDLMPEEINRKYGDRVAQACDRHFTGLVPPRGEDNLYTHLFRAVYATIATFWYCPSWVEPTEYKAAIQGHYAVLDETDPTLRRSLTASRHYADYEIADAVIAQAGGKRKGIKLGWSGVQPIQIFQRTGEGEVATIARPERLPTPQTQAMPQSASQPSQRKRTPRKSVWINYQDQAAVEQVLSHFGATDTTEAKISAMSRWLHWSLEMLQAVAPPESDGSIAAQQTAIVTPANTPDAPPTEPTTRAAPPPQVQAPSAEVDDLKSMFAQTLQMFQALLQTQSQPSTTRTGDNGLAQSTATPRPDRVSLAHRAVASDRPPKPDAAAATNATLTQRRQNHSKSPEKATATAALTQQILQAIDDVKRYNLSIDQAQQPHKLKREITANFLKALTPNQRLINRILDQQQQAIDAHHQQLHIQPGHNSTYREKITLAQVQQSLRSGAIDAQA